MEEKELWMNKLKEKLGDYSEPLPASGWEQLEKELMPPVERKIYPYRKWTVAAAAVILLALGSSVSLYFLGTPAADEIRHAKTPALASVPDVLPDAQQPDMTGTTIEPVVRPVVKNRIAKAERNIPQPTANIDEPVKKEEQPSELNAQTGDRKEKEEVEPVEETKAIRHKPADTEQPRNKPRRPSSRDKLHIPAEKGERVIVSEVFALSQKGDPLCTVLVENAAEALANLIMNLVRVIDPDTVVLGGGIVADGYMHEKILEKLHPTTMRFVSNGVVITKLNPGFIGLLGAGAVAMNM